MPPTIHRYQYAFLLTTSAIDHRMTQVFFGDIHTEQELLCGLLWLVQVLNCNVTFFASVASAASTFELFKGLAVMHQQVSFCVFCFLCAFRSTSVPSVKFARHAVFGIQSFDGHWPDWRGNCTWTSTVVIAMPIDLLQLLLDTYCWTYGEMSTCTVSLLWKWSVNLLIACDSYCVHATRVVHRQVSGLT